MNTESRADELAWIGDLSDEELLALDAEIDARLEELRQARIEEIAA